VKAHEVFYFSPGFKKKKSKKPTRCGNSLVVRNLCQTVDRTKGGDRRVWKDSRMYRRELSRGKFVGRGEGTSKETEWGRGKKGGREHGGKGTGKDTGTREPRGATKRSPQGNSGGGDPVDGHPPEGQKGKKKKKAGAGVNERNEPRKTGKTNGPF